MAFLNRYRVRIQQTRVVSIDAQNVQHAKTLAEADVTGVGDVEQAIAQGAVVTATDVGVGATGAQLDRYDVTVKLIRQIVVDAVDRDESLMWARDDAANYQDSTDVRYHGVSKMLREKTGIA